MFQTYAIEYSLPGTAQTFGTTSVVDLDEARESGREEMGEAQRLELRQQIACRRWGNPARAGEIVLTEVIRLGAPTVTP